MQGAQGSAKAGDGEAGRAEEDRVPEDAQGADREGLLSLSFEVERGRERLREEGSRRGLDFSFSSSLPSFFLSVHTKSYLGEDALDRAGSEHAEDDAGGVAVFFRCFCLGFS